MHDYSTLRLNQGFVLLLKINSIYRRSKIEPSLGVNTF